MKVNRGLGGIEIWRARERKIKDEWEKGREEKGREGGRAIDRIRGTERDKERRRLGGVGGEEKYRRRDSMN